MESDKELTGCFREAGRKYGFDKILARYLDYRDLKVRWQRTPGVIEFQVSDYLREIPGNMMYSLAETLFAKIAGEYRDYPPGLWAWVSQRGFAQRHRAEYLERCKRVVLDPKGAWKNLDDSLKRLKTSGLITGDEDVQLIWSTERTFRRYAHSSVVMRVVVVSSEMDDDLVPDYVIDWLVYSEMCHIMAGFGPGDPRVCEVEAELASRFLMRPQAEWWIRDKIERERREAEAELNWSDIEEGDDPDSE